MQDVLTRNMRLRFGLCDIAGCKNRYSDRAHLFGRSGTGARLGEPWCSLPELCLAVCREHHNQLDRGGAAELLAQLRWQAIGRVTTRWPGLDEEAHLYSDPIDAIRWAADQLDKTLDFDPDTLKFSRKEI